MAAAIVGCYFRLLRGCWFSGQGLSKHPQLVQICDTPSGDMEFLLQKRTVCLWLVIGKREMGAQDQARRLKFEQKNIHASRAIHSSPGVALLWQTSRKARSSIWCRVASGYVIRNILHLVVNMQTRNGCPGSSTPLERRTKMHPLPFSLLWGNEWGTKFLLYFPYVRWGMRLFDIK